MPGIAISNSGSHCLPHHRPRRAARLLVLALCGVLLGGCVLAYKQPGLRDLPAYDPERGAEKDALLYTGGDLVIRSVDGKDVYIGLAYWEDTGPDGMYRYYPMGPKPTLRNPRWRIFRFPKIKYDSVLLSPGMHKIGPQATEVKYNEKTKKPEMFHPSGIADVYFEARAERVYKLYRYYEPGREGDWFWVIVVEATCTKTSGDWPWDLSSHCFKEGKVVGSLNLDLIGKSMKELYPEY